MKETIQPQHSQAGATIAASNKAVALQVHLPDKADKELLDDLLAFAGSCGLKCLYLSVSSPAGEGPTDLPPVKSANVQCYYLHTPLIKAALLNEVLQFPHVFQPMLFCRKNYFKKHLSWGFPIFHFIDDAPEIYDLESKNGKVELELQQSEDVAAVYLFKRGAYERPKNVIYALQKDNGTLRVEAGNGSYSVVVMRHCYLFNDNGLSFRLNLHDDFILKRHRSIVPDEKSGYHGALIDGDALFGNSELVSAGPEVTRMYAHLSSRHFREDMALYWLRFGNTRHNNNPILNRLINHYINGTFWPKTKLIAKEVQLQANILNPFFINNLAALHCNYTIDEDRFLHDRSYYLHTLANLKRSASFRAAHNVFHSSVVMDDFLCDKLNFDEKKEIVAALAAAGATRFVFPLSLPRDGSYPHIRSLLKEEEQRQLYRRWSAHLRDWISYVNAGSAVTETALLYPGLDAEDDTFMETLDTLDGAGHDTDVLDFDTFLSKECTVEDGLLAFKGRRYVLLVLAGVKVIPLKAMEKVQHFIQNGGCVAGLKNLPLKCAESHHNGLLKNILKECWVVASRLDATTFKLHDGGGLAYFQSRPGQILDIISEISERFETHTKPPHQGVKTITRLVGKTRYLFYLNNSGRSLHNLPLSFPGDTLVSMYNNNSNRFESLLENVLSLEPRQSVLLKIENVGNRLADSRRQWLKVREVALDSDDWHLDDGRLEYRIALGDRSRSTPYNWRRQMYTKAFSMPQKPDSGERILLNLGELKDWCTLYWNNIRVETRLFSPWLFDVTDRVLPGKNVLGIEVGYRLSNFYAGANGTTERLHPVVPYGLMGPVKVEIYRAL